MQPSLPHRAAALVVWDNGQPRKSDYRTFNIKSVSGPDDFASMAEAVTRRYRRLIAEGRRLPDLVLIDGGAGQVGAAVRAIAAEGLPTLTAVGLAKRDEEIYLQGGGPPIRLDRASPALQLLQRIRDEAHRFAIKGHRRRRARRHTESILETIAGLGPAKRRTLLRHFGGLQGVMRAGVADLEQVSGIGASLARSIYDHLHPGD